MRLVILLSLAPFCVAQDKPPDFFRLPPHLKLWDGFTATPQAKPPVPKAVQTPKPPPPAPCMHARIVRPPNRDPRMAVALPAIRSNMPIVTPPPACLAASR